MGLRRFHQVVTPWKPFYGHLKTNSPVSREEDNPFLLCQDHCPGAPQNLTPDKRRQLQRVLVAERGAQDSHLTYQYDLGQVSSLQWASVSPSVKWLLEYDDLRGPCLLEGFTVTIKIITFIALHLWSSLENFQVLLLILPCKVFP